MTYNRPSTPVKVGRRTVGYISGRLFWKTVRGSKHMLRSPKGWAIEADIFDTVIRGMCNGIEVTDLDTNIIYVSLVDNFYLNKQAIQRGKFGRQYVLPLEFWSEKNG